MHSVKLNPNESEFELLQWIQFFKRKQLATKSNFIFH